MTSGERNPTKSQKPGRWDHQSHELYIEAISPITIACKIVPIHAKMKPYIKPAGLPFTRPDENTLQNINSCFQSLDIELDLHQVTLPSNH